jgi:multimeric flavodoxin WrbA/putative sterol carrier protein
MDCPGNLTVKLPGKQRRKQTERRRKVKIVAINGSPHGAGGNTERILQPFLEGAREAGAETDVIYLKGKEIKHCLGCFTCWTRTPGVCVHEDDMPALLEKVKEAGVLVFATPLYIFTYSGLMKDFLDRMLPMAQPFIIQQGDHFTHPPRYSGGDPVRYVLISNAGFPERHHFSGLEETFSLLVDASNGELAGMICCSAGELLRQEALQDQLAWYLEAARKAGRQVVEQGRISPETQAVLDRPLVKDPAAYANMANGYWRSLGVEMIAGDGSAVSSQPAPPSAHGTPLPPPQGRGTMRDLVAGMAMVINPTEAGALEAVIQFRVSGEDPGDYYLDITPGSCVAYEGEHPDPTLTINTPSGVWMAISHGEMNGATALMTGKYSVKGDMGLLMRLNKLFSAA